MSLCAQNYVKSNFWFQYCRMMFQCCLVVDKSVFLSSLVLRCRCETSQGKLIRRSVFPNPTLVYSNPLEWVLDL